MEVLIDREDAKRLDFNNYLDEALPFNPEKSHVVSEHETRWGIDSTIMTCLQVTSNNQNCRANSLLSYSSCSSTSISKTVTATPLNHP